MGSKSLIYRHVLIYRFIMNLLYLSGYRKRFTPIIEQIKNKPLHARILELCFGDIYIAKYCKNAHYRWKGLDLNKQFVQFAQKSGFDAEVSDITTIRAFPPADMCIMIGSFYHFHQDSFAMLDKMFKSSNTILISEPVLNLSASRGFIGFLARRAANTGKGREEFRYDKLSFLKMLEENSNMLNYQIELLQDHGKDLIVKLIK
jgi:hypothetical protein